MNRETDQTAPQVLCNGQLLPEVSEIRTKDGVQTCAASGFEMGFLTEHHRDGVQSWVVLIKDGIEIKRWNTTFLQEIVWARSHDEEHEIQIGGRS